MEFLIIGIGIVFGIVGIYYYLRLRIPYSDLFVHFSDGISIISQGKIIDCNDALVKLFGYGSKKDFLDIHPLELSPPFQPDGEFSIDKSQQMMREVTYDHPVTFDWVFLDAKGNEKWIEITIIALKQPFARDLYFMIWKNINQRKLIQEELENLNSNLESMMERKSSELLEKEHMLFFQSKQAQMGEMISMIAHQWRQPLSSIGATVINLKMKIFFKLQKGDQSGDPFIEYIDEQLSDIEKYTQSLTATIDDFRDFYRPQKEKIEVPITQTITKAYNIVKGSLRSSDIRVSMEFKSERIIPHYEGEIIHVFLNLFNNAMENFQEKRITQGDITITTEYHSGRFFITFCDNGGGIAKENREKIFSPYFTTKQNNLGTGLGLYMSKKILTEHHNGGMRLRNVDGGACFLMEIRE